MSFQEDYAKGKESIVRLMDGDVPLRIWHDGSATEAGTAVTAATITATADTSITLTINGAADSRVGSSGVLAVSTYDTFQKIKTEILTASGWHCELVDCRGADDSSNIAAITEVTCFKTAVDVNRDNSDTKQMGVGLTRAAYGESMDGYQAFLEAIYSNMNVTTNLGALKIYDCDDQAQSDTLKFQTPGGADVTDYWYPTNGSSGEPIMAVKPGHRILVYYLATDTNDPTTGSRIGLIGSIVPIYK